MGSSQPWNWAVSWHQHSLLLSSLQSNIRTYVPYKYIRTSDWQCPNEYLPFSSLYVLGHSKESRTLFIYNHHVASKPSIAYVQYIVVYVCLYMLLCYTEHHVRVVPQRRLCLTLDIEVQLAQWPSPCDVHRLACPPPKDREVLSIK